MLSKPAAKRSAKKIASTPKQPVGETSVLDIHRIERKRKAVERLREDPKSRAYFISVAKARYVIRKAFRIVEEQAKLNGIDPLLHQALIQIHGSERAKIQVSQLAERLDISPAFASSIVSTLEKSGFASRAGDKDDQRVTVVSMTPEGEKLLVAIDERVRFHVNYFTSQLEPEEREDALSILLFYVGATLR